MDIRRELRNLEVYRPVQTLYEHPVQSRAVYLGDEGLQIPVCTVEVK